jgi:hypothetical protein
MLWMGGFLRTFIFICRKVVAGVGRRAVMITKARSKKPTKPQRPPPNQQPFPPTPPRTQRMRASDSPQMLDPEDRQENSAPSPSPPQPSPPRRQRPAPPHPQADRGQDYIPEQVGCSLYDSLKILGLGLGASERKVKLAYGRLACLYHPDKWEQACKTTGMNLQETTAHFQLLNKGQSFLRATL